MTFEILSPCFCRTEIFEKSLDKLGKLFFEITLLVNSVKKRCQYKVHGFYQIFIYAKFSTDLLFFRFKNE